MPASHTRRVELAGGARVVDQIGRYERHVETLGASDTDNLGLVFDATETVLERVLGHIGPVAECNL